MKPRIVRTSRARPTVAIVGAGICGLGIGWRLAAAGCPVTVFDRGRAGEGASRVAAGMLAATAEVEPGEEALVALTREAQAAWPEFARELAQASGVDPWYRDDGTLSVAVTRDEVERLDFTHRLQRDLGLDAERLSGVEARRLESYLSPAVSAAVFSPRDHQVDSRRVVQGLRSAFLAAGGNLHEHAPVTAVHIAGGRVRGIRSGGETHRADVVVLAAGAWSRSVAGLADTARPPVRPIKGQVVELAMDPAAPLLTRVLWGPGVYLVPRRDGRLIVGATVEEKGFDDRLTAGGVLALLESAWRVLPGIDELPIGDQLVGFRPGSPDDAPILGPGPVEGLVYATGHHRNGILLAPVTGDAVSEFILTGRVPGLIAAFGPDRFDRDRPTVSAAAGMGE